MKNNINYLYFIFLLVTASCVKDNSNDKFDELWGIKINKIRSEFIYILGDSLKISPDLTSRSDVTGKVDSTIKEEWSYLWTVYASGINSKIDTLSTEKDLRVVIGGSVLPLDMQYNLRYMVTDTKTGVWTHSLSKIRSTTQYGIDGLLILYEKNNHCEVDLFDNAKKVIPDLYSTNNSGEKLPLSYSKIAYSNSNRTLVNMTEIYLFNGESYEGGIVLDPLSMAKERTFREMFDQESSEPTLNCQKYLPLIMNSDYMIMNQKLYKRAINSMREKFEPTNLIVSGGLDYRINTCIHMHSRTGQKGTPIFFDELNKRLICHTPQNKGTLARVNPTITDITHFDPDNLGNYSLVAFGRMGNASPDYWLLMKNNETDLFTIFRFTFKIVGDTFGVTTTFKKDIPKVIAPNLYNAKFIAEDGGVDGLCFFATDRSCGLFNVKNFFIDQTLPGDLLFPPVGENIEIIKMEYVPSLYNVAVPGKQLRLYVLDHNYEILKGGFILLDVASTGGINLVERVRRVGGYCDRVIDLCDKRKIR